MTIKQQGGIFGRNPAFNDVEVNKIDADNIRIDGNTISSTNSNGDINVSPNGSGREILTGALELRRTTALSNYVDNFDNPLIYSSYAGGNIGVNSALVLQPRGSAALPIILANGNGAGNMAARLRVEASGDVTVSTGNLVIGTSGQGIDFSATSGTGTSELFDDYEEGSWSPVISDGTNNATMSGDTGGYYTKIGNQVVITGRAETSSLGSVSGSIRITGLPYTVANVGAAATGAVASLGTGLNITAGQSVAVRPSNGQSYLELWLWDSTTGSSNMDAAEWSADGQIFFSLTYLT